MKIQISNYCELLIFECKSNPNSCRHKIVNKVIYEYQSQNTDPG